MTKKYVNYYMNSYLKTCGRILFEKLGLKFRPDCRYLRYLRCMGFNVKGETDV